MIIRKLTGKDVLSKAQSRKMEKLMDKLLVFMQKNGIVHYSFTYMSKDSHSTIDLDSKSGLDELDYATSTVRDLKDNVLYNTTIWG